MSVTVERLCRTCPRIVPYTSDSEWCHKCRPQQERRLRNERLVQTIDTFTRNHGYPPSLRQLRVESGMSMFVLRATVETARQDGLLRPAEKGKTARGLAVIHQRCEHCGR